MRTLLPILAALLTSGCSHSNHDGVPLGLTCTSPNGALLRLNLDLAAGAFQKEGFRKTPIVAIDDTTIILLRHSSTEMVITASLDRQSLTYTAATEDRVTRQQKSMTYRCLRGPAFAVGR